MRSSWRAVENNVKSKNWDTYINRVTRFLDYELNIKKMPKTVELTQFDESALAKDLFSINNDPEQEAEGNVLTPRMEWVQEQLKKMKLKFFDTRYKNDQSYSSFVTAVPFISDHGKPATFYVASTNQYEGNGKYTADRLSGVVMALTLAAQLKESEEYKNVVILFVNQHDLRGTTHLIGEMIQKRLVNVSVSAIVELCHFVGPYPITEAPFITIEENIFQSLISKVGKCAVTDSLENCQLTDELSDLDYQAVQFGSTIDDDLYEELLDEGIEESLSKAESQVNFYETDESKIIRNLLCQHAIIMSSYNFYNGLDEYFKH